MIQPIKLHMKLLTIIVLFFFFIHNISSQTTAIPDTAFEQKLIALGIDSDLTVNGQILDSDAAGVNSLNLYFSNISDLTGIEAFTSVDTLYCHNNNLSNLNLSSNTSNIN